jgi:tetratricopeptide (TPR) repeat protein
MPRRPLIDKQSRDARKRVPPAGLDRGIRQTTTISLPLLEFVSAGAVFLVALIAYSWTLAPTVTLTDSGELIVTAQGLGVAHPPGFPLWVILAHLASLMPLGNVAVRINFSSALFAALASAMLTLVVAESMMTPRYSARPKKDARQKKAEELRPAELLICAPALGAGLLIAFSRTLWSYATIAEVYTLNTLLILTIFFLMLRWRRRIVADRTHSGVVVTAHDRWLYAAALVFGLALGVHHVTVGLILPALAILVYRTEGVRFFASRRLLYAALISIAGLLFVYAYLPYAASRSPVINWGTPRSLQEIWWHITGRQYRVFLSFTPDMMGAQFVEFCRMLVREFGPVWLSLPLLVAFAGFVRAFKTDRTAFWFLLAIIIADVGYGISYNIAEDKDAYYLPTFISIAIAAGFGLRWVIQLTLSRSLASARSYSVAAAAVLLTSATTFAANWPFNNRRHYFIAHDYVQNLLSTIEPNGLLLTQDWQVVSPMFYAQEVEQLRRDAKIVDINLLRRSWYFDYLGHAYPGFVERSRDKIESFVALLKQWERDPAAFARSESLTQRISAAFFDMIRSVVTEEQKIAPVYITKDLLQANTTNSEATKWITQNYQLVPQGLVFYLASDQSFHDSPEPHLQTRGLADGTLRFEKDDAVSVKVLPSYSSMLVNRGRYLALFNQHERAIRLFEEALSLNPGLVMAREELAKSMAKLTNP